MVQKILVANRGEIACRILRTCRRLGLRTVAIHSDADEGSPHVRMADEAFRVGPPPVRESYLNVEAIIDALKRSGADAVHPGYGLLSERRSFAEAVAEAGARFIGPPPEALEAFGDKLKARAVARSAGALPPPGSDGALDPSDTAALSALADRIGYPLLVKAAGGGGGIGMQRVAAPAELERAVRTCSDRGRAAFADDRVYLERYLASPRHIEVQVFCDDHGNAVALGERECSVQRRHQKIIEEALSPAAFFEGAEGRERRKNLYDRALAVVQAANYRGAGTVEFVADASGELWFLEVNARLQVEHPVTEMIAGVDLVEWQILVADGQPLPKNFSFSPNGHAVEARVYAEDPAKKFVPQPGRLARIVWPEAGPDLRVETGVEEGGEVTPYYDPLIAKIVAHGQNRAEAITKLDSALALTQIELVGARGPAQTNLSFLRQVLKNPNFAAGTYDTSLAEALAAGKA